MTTTSESNPRPLSPHLGIYKPQMSSTLSIFHRATGVGLTLGLPVLVIWITMLAGGKQVYALFTDNFKSVLGEISIFVAAFVVIVACFAYINRFIQKTPPTGILKCVLFTIDVAAALALTSVGLDYASDHFFPAVTHNILADIGIALLVGWTWAFAYHFCCGIRHLFWDAGWFLHIKGMQITGWITILISAATTAALWAKIWGYIP